MNWISSNCLKGKKMGLSCESRGRPVSRVSYEKFQKYGKREELHVNTCFTYHLDSVINISLYLFNHVSVEKF